jgi:hypothetical protein
MFHVKHLLVLTFWTLFGSAAVGQGTVVLEQQAFVVNRSRDTEIVRFLSGFPGLSKLDSVEQENFYWINVLRKDPRGFSKTYITPFVSQFTGLDRGYVRSLQKTLDETDPLPLLAPAQVVQAEAQRHAIDMARNLKRISHSSSDGRSFGQRMDQAGIRGCGGENVFEGEEDALVALLLLLIDSGVPSLGHRKALLNPAFNVMGVAAEPSGEGRVYLVQLFSCQ